MAVAMAMALLLGVGSMAESGAAVGETGLVTGGGCGTPAPWLDTAPELLMPLPK